ncbi:DUF5006 domain-containing protein [Bacteroides congonensis]
MIKKILYGFLPVCLLMGGLTGCKDDTMEPLPETVPLIVEASAKSFVMGEKLVLTVKVNDAKNPDRVSNEDFDIYLTAKDGEKDASRTAFKSFPSMVTFPKGEKSFDIELPIIETGLEAKQKLYVNVTSFVRGYAMKEATQSIVISDLHYTVVSLKNNSDRVINEGDEFTIRAEVPVPVTDDMDINITVPDEQKDFYATLPPATLKIKAGEKIGEVTAKTKHNTEPTQTETLTLNFTTLSGVHPLDNGTLEITMNDLEAEKGNEIDDERWVYDQPGTAFASSAKLAAAISQYGQAREIKEMDPHPNAALAAAGWKFYNAWEFHSFGNSGDMWNNNNSFGNKLPQFLAARNTVIVQNHAACINEQFSNITEQGYLQMIQMKVTSTATAPAKGTRDYGTSAYYGCGTGSAWKSNSQLISAGCRMEIRARLRGQRNGFNMGIWLMSDDAASQMTYSEIDILENPVGSATGNRAHQTFHGGLTTTDKNSKTANNTINMENWNIYWLEWRSDTEVALGINGKETVCLKKSEWTEDQWTFTNDKNQKGLKFILTMGAPSPWALGKENGTESGGVWGPNPELKWDAGFAAFNNYERDKNNDAIPRMEIDWVRTYINKPSVAEYDNGRSRNTTKFY